MTAPPVRHAPAPPRRFAFVLVPEFSLMPFTAAIEALRAANRMSGEPRYRWCTASFDGQPVAASNGVTIAPDAPFATAAAADVLLVCAGLNAAHHADRRTAAALRRAARGGAVLGSVCTGSVLLAAAGLLDGYRCTIHWEDVAAFAESHPRLRVTNRLYEIDRDRITCSGGTAPLDLMLHLIAADGGRALAASVAELMLHHHRREPGEPQRLALAERLGVRHPRLLEAIALMEQGLETPLPLAAVARRAGLSPRQLERLFAERLGTTPSRHYRALRLQRARELVRKSAAPLAQIAVATGFASAAHFAQCYRRAFGVVPSADRAAPPLRPGG